MRCEECYGQDILINISGEMLCNMCLQNKIKAYELKILQLKVDLKNSREAHQKTIKSFVDEITELNNTK